MLVAVYRGKIAKGGKDGLNDTSDKTTNAMVILVTNWYRGGEKVAEQQNIEKFSYLSKSESQASMKYLCVSRQGASLDTGRHIITLPHFQSTIIIK